MLLLFNVLYCSVLKLQADILQNNARCNAEEVHCTGNNLDFVMQKDNLTQEKPLDLSLSFLKKLLLCTTNYNNPLYKTKRKCLFCKVNKDHDITDNANNNLGIPETANFEDGCGKNSMNIVCTEKLENDQSIDTMQGSSRMHLEKKKTIRSTPNTIMKGKIEKKLRKQRKKNLTVTL